LQREVACTISSLHLLILWLYIQTISAVVIVPPNAIPQKLLYSISSFIDILNSIRKNVNTVPEQMIEHPSFSNVK